MGQSQESNLDHAVLRTSSSSSQTLLSFGRPNDLHIYIIGGSERVGAVVKEEEGGGGGGGGETYRLSRFCARSIRRCVEFLCFVQ